MTITKGKDRGKTGKVIRVLPDDGKVAVEALNVYKKHVRARQQGQKGEVVSVTRPLPVANVALHCPRCHRGVRAGRRYEGKVKVRYCKRCKGTL